MILHVNGSKAMVVFVCLYGWMQVYQALSGILEKELLDPRGRINL